MGAVTVRLGTGQSASASYTISGAPSGKPVFGFNYDVDGGLAGVAHLLGCNPLTLSKVFNSSPPPGYPGHPIPATVTWPLTTVKIALTSSAPWISAADQASLAAIFAAMPTTGTPEVTVNQEGEAPRFFYSAPQVAGSHLTAYGIFKTHAPPNAIYCQDLQTYSASPGGRGAAFPAYLCCASNGQVDLPRYRLDWYPTNTTTDAVASVTPAVGYIRARVANPVIGAAEVNWLAGNGAYHGPGTSAQFFSEAWAYAVANQFDIYMPYFLSAHNTPWPSDPATMSALSSIAHESGL